SRSAAEPSTARDDNSAHRGEAQNRSCRDSEWRPRQAREDCAMKQALGWLVVIALTVTGCAGIRPTQRDDIIRWEAEARRLGHPEVKYEKYIDPDTAMWVGFLPGGGFYVPQIDGLDAPNVSSIFWPLSMLWVPARAHAAAEVYNYLEFRDRILALRQDVQP